MSQRGLLLFVTVQFLVAIYFTYMAGRTIIVISEITINMLTYGNES